MEGKIRNFNVPASNPLLPLFEAIVNSIHAIDERHKTESDYKNGEIIIYVYFKQFETLNNMPEDIHLEGFSVEDNGCGFNDINMESFLKSDSTHKKSIGGKGLGRFSWLKVFKSVHVKSSYKDSSGKFKVRDFKFDVSSDIDDQVRDASDVKEPHTVITLTGVKSSYEVKMPKSLNAIANKIVQHCLMFFLRPDCPQIILKLADETNTKSLNLNGFIKEKLKNEGLIEDFYIGNEKFQIQHLKFDADVIDNHYLILCADYREVKRVKLETKISDVKGIKKDFFYIGLLTGNYLDSHVDMTRLNFIESDLADDEDNLFTNEIIKIDDITLEAARKVKEYLMSSLEPVRKNKINRINAYIKKKQPKYSILFKYCKEDLDNISPEITEDEDKLDDSLNVILRKLEHKIEKEGNDFINNVLSGKRNDLPIVSDEKNFHEILQKITDVNQAALASYVIHRKFILKLLKEGLQQSDDGKYSKEKFIHNLIFPMRKTGSELMPESQNLWLVDERLAYSYYIASDKKFDKQKERPDILFCDAFSYDKANGPYDSVSIIELKRPMRDDYTLADNPIDQVLSYAKQIINQEATNDHGRIIKISNGCQFYLYAICDITKGLMDILDTRDFTRMPDGMGYYAFNKKLNAYIAVLSFDKILNDSEIRNKMFFDKLGIPSLI